MGMRRREDKFDKDRLESEYFRSYCDLRKFTHMKNPEISISLHSPGGGVYGEFIVVWVMLNNRLVPKLEAFDDSWRVLSCFSDLLDKLAEVDSENILPNEFIEILNSLGFINSDSYEGDFIPKEMFDAYQTRRKRDKKLDELIS